MVECHRAGLIAFVGVALFIVPTYNVATACMVPIAGVNMHRALATDRPGVYIVLWIVPRTYSVITGTRGAIHITSTITLWIRVHWS